MKRILIALIALIAVAFSPFAIAQTACDVAFIMDMNTADGHDVSTATNQVYGVPYADVLDNHAKGLKILSAASQQQDKGGPYTIQFTETRACDGGAAVTIQDGSLFVKGVTLDGANKIARAALQQADQMTKRYEDRAKGGAKAGWDHGKAKKVKLDADGSKVKQ